MARIRGCLPPLPMGSLQHPVQVFKKKEEGKQNNNKPEISWQIQNKRNIFYLIFKKRRRRKEGRERREGEKRRHRGRGGENGRLELSGETSEHP